MLSFWADRLYDFAYCATGWTYLLGWSLRVEGVHNIPRTGPVLLVANHQSFLDPVAIGLAAPRRLSYLARKSLFTNRYFGGLLRAVNCVPIDQEGVGKEGMQAILGRLKAGRAVLVFPEGERCGDGALHPLRPGISLLIKRAQAPIVAVGIAGAFQAWPRSRKLPRLAPLFLPASERSIAVSVGPLRAAAAVAGRPRDQMLAQLLADIDRQYRRAEKLQRK